MKLIKNFKCEQYYPFWNLLYDEAFKDSDQVCHVIEETNRVKNCVGDAPQFGLGEFHRGKTNRNVDTWTKFEESTS